MQTFFEDDSYLYCYAQNGSTDWINNMYQESCNFDVGLDSFSKVEVLVYPNPSHTFFTIQVETSEPIYYKMLSLEGKLISQGSLYGDDKIGHDLNKGTYFLQILTNSGTATRKIIKY